MVSEVDSKFVRCVVVDDDLDNVCQCKNNVEVLQFIETITNYNVDVSSCTIPASIIGLVRMRLFNYLQSPTYGMLFPSVQLLSRMLQICLKTCESSELQRYSYVSIDLMLSASASRVQNLSKRSIGLIICNTLLLRRSALSDEVDAIERIQDNLYGYVMKILPLCNCEELTLALNIILKRLRNHSSLMRNIDTTVLCRALSNVLKGSGLICSDKECSAVDTVEGHQEFLIDMNLDSLNPTVTVEEGNRINKAQSYWNITEYSCKMALQSSKAASLSADGVLVCSTLLYILNLQIGNYSVPSAIRLAMPVKNSSNRTSTLLDLSPLVMFVWICRAEESFTGHSACRCNHNCNNCSLEDTIRLANCSLLCVSVLIGELSAHTLSTSRKEHSHSVQMMRLACQVNHCRQLIRSGELLIHPWIDRSPTKSPSRNVKRKLNSIDAENGKESMKSSLNRLIDISNSLDKLLLNISKEEICSSIVFLLDLVSAPSAVFTDAGLYLISEFTQSLLTSATALSVPVIDVVQRLVKLLPALAELVDSARISEVQEAQTDDNCKDCSSMSRTGFIVESNIVSLCGRPLRLTGLKLLVMHILLLSSVLPFTTTDHVNVFELVESVLKNQLDDSIVLMGASVLRKHHSKPSCREKLCGLLWRMWSRPYAVGDRTQLALIDKTSVYHRRCGLSRSLSMLWSAITDTEEVKRVHESLKQAQCSDIAIKLFNSSAVVNVQSSYNILWTHLWNCADDTERLYIIHYVAKLVFRDLGVKHRAVFVKNQPIEEARNKMKAINEIPLLLSNCGKRSAERENLVITKWEQVTRIGNGEASSIDKKPARAFQLLGFPGSHPIYIRHMMSTLPALLAYISRRSGDSKSDLADACSTIVWLMNEITHVIQNELSISGVYKDFIISLANGNVDADSICQLFKGLMEELQNAAKGQSGVDSLTWIITAFKAIAECSRLFSMIVCPCYEIEISNTVLNNIESIVDEADANVETLVQQSTDDLQEHSNYRVSTVGDQEFEKVLWDEELTIRVNTFIEKVNAGML